MSQVPLDVMDRQKHTISNLRWIILIVDGLMLILNYGDRAAIGVGTPFIMKEFHFSAAIWGIILGAFSFGYAPFNFIGGWTSDKYGPRKIMGYAVIWWSAFTAAIAIGFNFISFFIIRLLFGFGEGPQASVTAKTMGNWFPKREIGTAVGLANTASPLGGAIGTPLVALLVASTGNWRLPFVVLGIIGIFFAVGWFFIVRDTPEKHPWMSAKELNEINSGYLPREPEVIKQDSTAPSTWTYVKQPLVWSIAVAFFGGSWILFTFLTWFPTYLVQAQHVNIQTLAIAGSIPWITSAIGMALGGIITDWIGKKTGKPAASRKWFIVCCMIVQGVAFVPCAFVHSPVAAVTLMSLANLVGNLNGAQWWAILADLVPASRLGGVGGFMHCLANTAGIVAPIVMGLSVTYTHSWMMGFLVAGAVLILSAFFLMIFGNVKKMEQMAK